jgi:hypothetical protein
MPRIACGGHRERFPRPAEARGGNLGERGVVGWCLRYGDPAAGTDDLDQELEGLAGLAGRAAPGEPRRTAGQVAAGHRGEVAKLLISPAEQVPVQQGGAQ